MSNSSSNLQVYTTFIIDASGGQDVRYRFNHLVIEIDYRCLYQMFEINNQPKEIQDNFITLATPDNWVNYIDVLDFIKKHKYFSMSRPLFTWFLIEAFTTLRSKIENNNKASAGRICC